MAGRSAAADTRVARLPLAGNPHGADREPARQSFPRAMRLLKRTDFEAVYGAGQRRSSPQFSVFFRAQTALSNEASRRERMREDSPAEGLAASRFGISVKKTLGGAVVRNRIRRRIREILRRNRAYISKGWDIVIHPRRSAAEAPFAPLEAELVRLLRSLPSPAPKT